MTSGAVYGDEHVVGRHFLGVVPYRHHGIELADGTLCENSPPGVRITSYADVARGCPTWVTNPDATAAERARDAERGQGLALGGKVLQDGGAPGVAR